MRILKARKMASRDNFSRYERRRLPWLRCSALDEDGCSHHYPSSPPAVGQSFAIIVLTHSYPFMFYCTSSRGPAKPGTVRLLGTHKDLLRVPLELDVRTQGSPPPVSRASRPTGPSSRTSPRGRSRSASGFEPTHRRTSRFLLRGWIRSEDQNTKKTSYRANGPRDRPNINIRRRVGVTCDSLRGSPQTFDAGHSLRLDKKGSVPYVATLLEESRPGYRVSSPFEQMPTHAVIATAKPQDSSLIVPQFVVYVNVAGLIFTCLLPLARQGLKFKDVERRYKQTARFTTGMNVVGQFSAIKPGARDSRNEFSVNIKSLKSNKAVCNLVALGGVRVRAVT